jgi:tetratricopeptide (TPR) repeat protein
VLDVLVRRRTEARVLVLASLRTGVDAAHHARLDDLERHAVVVGRATSLDLDLLRRRDVATYLATRFPQQDFPPAIAERLYERTEGNPLFMTSIVDDLVADGAIVRTEGGWTANGALDALGEEVPPTIGRFVQRQLAALSEDTVRRLRAASVVGTTFSAAAVAAALERPIEPVDAVCDELAKQSRFLRRAGIARWPDGTLAGQFRFVHALYRATIYEQCALRERAAFHVRVASRLDAAHGPGPIAGEIARHLLAAHEGERAIPHLLGAVQLCVARHAIEEATTHLSAALEAPMSPRVALRVRAERANVLRLSGSPECLRDCQRLIDEARAQGDLEWQARGLIALAWDLPLVDASRALPMYDEARAVAERLGDSAIGAEARGLYAYWHAVYHELTAEDVREIRRAARLLSRKGVGLQARLLACLTHVLYVSSDYEGALRAAGRASAVALRTSAWNEYGLAQVIAAEAEVMLGRLGAAHERARRLLEIGTENGNPMAIALCLQVEGLVAHHALDHERALALAEQALELGAPIGIPLIQWRSLALGAAAAAALGDAARAGSYLERCERFLPMMDLGARLWWASARVDTALADGAFDEAERRAGALLELAEGAGERTFVTLACCGLAEAALARGQRAEASRALARATRRVQEGAGPHGAWRCHALRERVATLDGKSPAAARQAQKAVLRELRASVRTEPVPTEALDRRIASLS